MKTPILKTERLILRPLSLEDAPAIQKHFNNWNIIRHLSMLVPWPYPDDGAESFIRDKALPAIATGKAHKWVLTLKDGNGEAIGLVDFHEQAGPDGGNRGFWLAEPYWKQGLMTEAVEAVQDWLFFEKGIDKLIVLNAKTNPGSRRVKEKTGARFLGETKLPHRGGDDEAEKWEVTRESWAQIRGKKLKPVADNNNGAKPL